MTSTPSSEFAIETTLLSKRYRKTPAVTDLDLRIPAGSTFGFIGPNGAGKSTTIRMLMGMLRISGGEARVLGFDPKLDAVSIKQHVGYVPELQFIYRWMRVHEAIGFCRSLYDTWNDELCADLVRQFDLDENKRVKQLSKGMVVKLALLLAVAHEPELLILDEPMAGLDPIAREEVLDGVLQSICDRGCTILFSSHTLSDVQRMADRVGIIDEGRLLVDCAVDELLGSTKRIRAVLTDGSTPSRPPDGTIWQRTEKREWLVTVKDFKDSTAEQIRGTNGVENVEVIDLSLEDIFKDYIRGRRASA